MPGWAKASPRSGGEQVGGEGIGAKGRGTHSKMVCDAGGAAMKIGATELLGSHDLTGGRLDLRD